MEYKFEDKTRIIQELVPGKQITLAHIIAGPDAQLFKKLGLDIMSKNGAIGILSATPGEISIIAADIAIKTADVELGFVDKENGTLIFVGAISAVESAINAINQFLTEKLDFTVCEITRT